MKRTHIAVATALSLAAALAAGPSVAQKAKDTVRVGLGRSVESLSWYFDPGTEAGFYSEALFDSLVLFDEKNFKFVPLLAKSWTHVNPTTIEFELRDDVKWHDGAPFTADDVVYTYSFIKDPENKLRFASNWNYIDHVEKVGPHKVRMVLTRPTPYDISRLAYQNAMLPAHALSKADDKFAYLVHKPVGTGMYKVVDVDRNKHVLFERNPDFKHGGSVKPASNIGKLEFIPMPDPGAQVAQFLVGGLDVLREPPLDQAEELAKTPGVVLTLTQGTSYMYLALDAKGRSGNKALQDVRVRRALMMAINRDEIMQLLTDGRKLDRTPEAMCWKFQQGCDYSVKPYPFDPDGAKKLLAEAGYADGFDLDLTTFTVTSTKAIATVLSNRFNQIGVRASVDARELSSYRKKQTDGKIQAIVANWPGGDADVQSTLDFIYAVPDSRDYHGDPELLELAKQNLTTTDPAARKEIGKKLFDRSTEMAYFIPVGPNPTGFLHKSDVTIHTGSFIGYGIRPQDMNWK